MLKRAEESEKKALEQISQNANEVERLRNQNQTLLTKQEEQATLLSKLQEESSQQKLELTEAKSLIDKSEQLL
jgi:capsule polysaccharide export protein KpsE/RkpR